ncbi:MAG: PatB family C-S lyase [Chloroflexota bacterium]
MTIDFDTFIDRRHQHNSIKWAMYPEDVLPLWVADMDFRSPEPVLRALHERVEHGVFGYQSDSPELRAVLVERMRARHHFNITSDQLLFLPGLVFGLNAVSRAVGESGSGVLVQTPVYPPFLTAPKNTHRLLQKAALASSVTNGILRYEIDFDALEAAVTPETRLFILCNPHNPVGRVYTRPELEGIADFCLRHDLIICADEIHCDLVYPGYEHISIATLSPEVAQKCVTLLAPSKTFNLPGFGLGFAVIENAELLNAVRTSAGTTGASVNALAYTAAQAAYSEGQAWLDELLVYLQGNRDALVDFVRENLPNVPVTQPEGTYLSWLDFRAFNLEPDPYTYFLDNARVAFNGGEHFDTPGFIRVNCGTTRATLMEALKRVLDALTPNSA